MSKVYDQQNKSAPKRILPKRNLRAQKRKLQQAELALHTLRRRSNVCSNSIRAADILALQRTLGNRASRRFATANQRSLVCGTTRVQRHITSGRADDAFEWFDKGFKHSFDEDPQKAIGAVSAGGKVLSHFIDRR